MILLLHSLIHSLDFLQNIVIVLIFHRRWTIGMATPTEEQRKAWPVPNFENPENLHGVIIGLTVPLLTLSVLCEFQQ